MARKTSQMCPKIWISSLQLGVKFSTKRLKTCQEPDRHHAGKNCRDEQLDGAVDRCEECFHVRPLQTAGRVRAIGEASPSLVG